MGWSKREAVTDLVILGDAEGNVKSVGGLLVGIEPDRGYPDKDNFKIEKQNGDVVTVSGSASLSRQIGPQDVGKFIKAEFQGWGKSPNGKFKAIDVHVWEGEPNNEMLKYPSYGKVKPTNGKPVEQKAPAQSDDEFPGALEAQDDDLPF